MTMTCKINKLEKPGGQLRIFHTLFGRSAAFYGHFQADTVTSEWSTRISSSVSIPCSISEGRKIIRDFTVIVEIDYLILALINSKCVAYKTA